MEDYKPIKADPDTKLSPNAMDEDIYEDAGDLDFNGFEIDPSSTIYMAKLPKYLWDQWSKLDKHTEAHIGNVRKVVSDDPKEGPKYRMLLNHELAIHQGVPKEYNLELIPQNPENPNARQDITNRFVFSEQDLPGYKSRSRQKFDKASANMPARLTRPSKIEKPKQAWDPNKKYEQYYKKAAPKRTALTHRIRMEMNCVPLDNEETREIMRVLTEEATRPKLQTRFINTDLSGHADYVQPGTIQSMSAMKDFIKTSTAPGRNPQGVKTARMPENELLDKIFDCFREYKYWSMKAFRDRLQQPEAYLRETLDKIAVLAKSGRFASRWSLKPENVTAGYDVPDDTGAPEDDSFGDDDDDDEDEDVKFEDVN